MHKKNLKFALVVELKTPKQTPAMQNEVLHHLFVWGNFEGSERFQLDSKAVQVTIFMI